MIAETEPRSSVGASARSLSQVHKWWASKIAPLLAVTFLALIIEPLGVGDAIRRGGAMLWSACLLATAAYVVNDWYDREVDRAIGKESAVMAMRGSVVAALHVALVVAAALPWLVLGLTTTTWVAFAAIVILPLVYSAPPLRWKTRGGLGVIADASLAHLAPATFALAAFGALDLDDRMAATVVAVAALIWSGAVGLRAIISHEIVDLEADRLAGVETWVGRIGVERATRLGTWAVFPVELMALSCVVVALAAFTAVPMVLLAATAVAMALARFAGAWVAPMLVVSTPTTERVLLFLFYRFWLGAAFLAGLIAVEPAFVTVVPVYLILFFPVARDELTSLVRGTVGTVRGLAWIIYGKGIRRAGNWSRYRLPEYASAVGAAAAWIGRGVASAATAAGRGLAAGATATGRGLAAGATATGRGLAAGTSAAGRGLGIAAGAIGRFFVSTWSTVRRFVWRAYRKCRRTILARTRSHT